MEPIEYKRLTAKIPLPIWKKLRRLEESKKIVSIQAAIEKGLNLLIKKMTPYEDQRNDLIPLAEGYADETAGNPPPSHSKKSDLDKYNALWNFAFHQKMNQLWKEECDK